MKREDLIKKIRVHFPNAEFGRIFFAKHNIMLEEQYGFTPENTCFAEGGCSDEINETEFKLLEQFWGERFKFGGLAGYCHGGRAGLTAVSQHVPEVAGEKNLLLVAGPHIGYDRGEWGKILRSGQSHNTTACGLLAAIIAEGYDTIKQKPADFFDRQRETVEQVMLPYLKKCVENGISPDIIDATKYLMQRIDRDLTDLVRDLRTHFEGQIAVITGIAINTEIGNFFSASMVEVYEK